MDAIEIMRILGEDLRVRFHKEELDLAILYFLKMMKDERIIMINENNHPHAIMAYSLTDDPDVFLKKDTWDYLPQNLLGKTLYVEKLFSKGWNKELRTVFEKMIIQLHPHVEYGLWYRYGLWGDRKVISKRRLQNVRD